MGLPDDVSVSEALHTAGAVGKMQALDFTFDTSTTYTFWSGLIGGLFLSMSYFGCDQSQVQRYLTAKSTDEARSSLLMSAYWKIPLQVLVLMVGVLMYVFFLFNPAPMLFNTHTAAIQRSPRATECTDLERQYTQANQDRQLAATAMAAAQRNGTPAATAEFARAEFQRTDKAVRDIRSNAKALVVDVTQDKNFGYELRVSDICDPAHADRHCRNHHRRHLCGRDVHHRGGTELAGDLERDRHLQAPSEEGWRRRALCDGVEMGHAVLGPVRLCRWRFTRLSWDR